MAISTTTTMFFLLFFIIPIISSLLLYRIVDFDAADLPDDYSYSTMTVPIHHNSILSAMERVGEGLLLGPEDLTYDAKERLIYTGCGDGWIRRIKLDKEGSPASVENWFFVGGRPLGVALAPSGELVIANADKGLMIVEKNGATRILTDQAEGERFGLTDGAVVASDGMIYFTDATSKYNIKDFVSDFLESRPYGRLLSFNPYTNETLVLVRDLYFANGVALTPQEDSLIFCETIMRRCKKYHIGGERKGTVDTFIEDIPGFPDNIKYDGKGHFWIGLPSGKNNGWDTMMKYPSLRKIMYIIGKKIEMSSNMKDGGVLKVDLEGKPQSLYTDATLSSINSGLKIGNHIYLGSLKKPYMAKVDLNKLVANKKD